MSNQRTHYVTTSDGVTLGGTVHGQGPPLVFLQGAVGDGDLDWGQVAEHLAGRYTCHLPSLRGRGLSGDHPDLSLARIIDDVVEYVDSIGETVGLTGWSGGGAWALAAAARSDAVSALAPFEPAMLILADEQERALVGKVVGHMVELLNEGDLPAAARAFAKFPLFDEEISAAADLGYFEASGRYVPNLLAVLQSAMVETIPPPTRPCSARSRCRWRFSSGRRPSRSSRRARSTSSNTSRTDGCTRSRASRTARPSPIPRRSPAR